MKNLWKLVSLLCFIFAFIGMYFYWQHEDKSNNELSSNENIKYDEALQDMSKPLTSRLDYDSEILFVYLGELNNGVLYNELISSPANSIASYNEETKSIYFYDDSKIPENHTNIMLLNGIYSMDTLLEENLITSNQEAMSYDFDDIDYHNDLSNLVTINNEDRLFLNENLGVEKLNKDGDIKLTFKENEYVLKVGDSKDFMLSKEIEGKKLKSKFVVTNYGMWKTVNMKYEVQERR